MDISNEVEQVLSSLSEKFGTTVSELWEIMILYHRIESGLSVVLSLAVLYGAYRYFFWVKRKFREAQDRQSARSEYSSTTYSILDDDIGFPLIFLSALVGLIAFTFFFIMERGITGLIVPEYFALEGVIELLK